LDGRGAFFLCPSIAGKMEEEKESGYLLPLVRSRLFYKEVDEKLLS